MYKLALTLLLIVAVLPCVTFAQPAKQDQLSLTQTEASHFAALAMKCIQKEYPNKLDHVNNDAADVRSPRAMHGTFYGCFDWHSSVHGHWMLVRLLRLFPALPEAREIRGALDANLAAENIANEVAYLKQSNRASFERTYGWAWLLKLAEELHDWNDQDGRRWSQNLQPLADGFAEKYLSFLPKQNYPIRTGVHPNTAFGLAFALDYARAVGNKKLETLIVERSRTYYAHDTNYPASWEPGGEDFFSPALMEADLMRRVMSKPEFARVVSSLSAGRLSRPAETIAATGDRNRPHRSKTGPPRRVESQPRLVHAQYRQRSAAKRSGAQSPGSISGLACKGRTGSRGQRQL